MVFRGFMRTETTRLILREYTLNDIDEVHVYGSDREVLRYMLWGPNSIKETKEFIELAIKESNEEHRTIYNLAIEHKESGSLIGGISLSLHDDEAEIGWILNQKVWRQGFGTEAARVMISIGFESYHLKRIFATCDADNVASYRTMMKCGMIQSAYQKAVRVSSFFGQARDQRCFEITKESFQNSNKNTETV